MMPQLAIAALFTTVLALVILTAMFWQFSGGERRQRYFLLAVLGLAMSPSAYFFVRLPLIRILEPAWLQTAKENDNPTVSQALSDSLRLTYAPLTEEPAKLLPWALLLALGFDLKPTRNRVAALALVIGGSFAIGEIWLVAHLISLRPDPAFTKLPWYAFGGFIVERLMTCFSHMLFVLPTVLLSRHGIGYAGLGLAAGSCLHAIGNAPIMLARNEAFGLSAATWGILLQGWLLLFMLASCIGLIAVHFGPGTFVRIWQNRMICPECGATYKRPMLLGINFGTQRYEPCGACHKWHWVDLRNLAPIAREEVPRQS